MWAHGEQSGFVAEIDLLAVETQRLDVHARIEAEHQVGSRPRGRAQSHFDLYSQKFARLDDDAASDVLHICPRLPVDGAVGARPVLARGQVIGG